MPNFTKFFIHVLAHGSGSIVLWRRFNILCTSGFVLGTISKGSDSADSKMPQYINYLELCSRSNSMNISFQKTKEMFLGNVNKNPPTSLCVGGNQINTVLNVLNCLESVSPMTYVGMHMLMPYVQKLHPDYICLLYTSPSPRDRTRSRMPSSA